MKHVTIFSFLLIYLSSSVFCYAQCNGVLSMTVTPNDTICKGDVVKISSGFSGSSSGWNFTIYKDSINAGNKISDTTSVSTAPSVTTTYYVTGDSMGCVRKLDSLIVIVNHPVINATSTPPRICPNNCVQLNATGAIKYSWYPFSNIEDSIGSSVMACPLSTITYSVEATDSNGCSDISSVTITVFQSPAWPTIFFNFSDSSHYFHPDSSYSSYQWYKWGVLVPGATDTSFFAGLCGGYGLMITDTNGCSVGPYYEPPISDCDAGIADNISADHSVSIYPNPVEHGGSIFISLPKEECMVNVFNMFGQKVKVFEHLSGMHVLTGLENLTNGVYIYEVFAKEGRTKGKLVIE